MDAGSSRGRASLTDTRAVSLGKSSSADLTKLYGDTSNLVRELREGGPGAFFSMKDITASIPKAEDH